VAYNETSKPGQTDSQATGGGESLQWTSHPLKRRPAVSAVVSGFIIVVAILIYYSTASTGFALLGLVILFASLARFYFPTSYRLSDREIMVKTVTQTLHKDWSLYRSCYPDGNGILLSPFTGPSRLENFRGLYMLFSDNRDEVTAFVRRRLGRTVPVDAESAPERPPAGSGQKGNRE